LEVEDQDTVNISLLLENYMKENFKMMLLKAMEKLFMRINQFTMVL